MDAVLCRWSHARIRVAEFRVTNSDHCPNGENVCKTHLSSSIAYILAIARQKGGAQFVNVTRIPSREA